MRSMVEGAFGIQVPPSVSFAATSPASQGRTSDEAFPCDGNGGVA